ncbi:MAG: LPS-assembly protein LptD [Armatimonadota bacterium]
MNLHRCACCVRLLALIGVLVLRPPLLAQQDGPAPPPPAVEAAQPEAEKIQPGRMRIRAQRQVFSPDAGVYRFFGEVSLTKSDLELRAQEMSYDAGKELLLASGDVSLAQPSGQTYTGQALQYHPKTGAWEFREWDATLPPSSLGKPFVAPVFASGDAVTGSEHLNLKHTHLTTCDLEHPDYEIVAGVVDIYPGDKLVARDVDIYVLGRRVLHLPWLYFFLRDERLPVMPEFGRNDIEGYFLRTPFQYVLGDDQLGTFRLDLTEKRGVGLGLDHFYALGGGSGEAFAYYNPSSSDYALRLNHDQQLLKTLTLDVDLDRKRQSLLSGTPVSISNTSVQLRNATERATTVARYTQNNTESNYQMHSTALSLRHDLKLGQHSRFSYSGDYRSNRYGASTAVNEELWNHLLYSRQLAFGDLSVRMDQFTDIDGNAGGSGLNRLERLPEVMLQVDQTRLGWKVPGRLQLGLGQYRERAGNDAMPRFLLDWQTTPSLKLTDHTKLNFTAGLRQTAYGDEDISAQYQYRFDVGAQTKLGSFTNTLSYGRQYGSGFSPLYMDAVYPRHAVNQNLRLDTPSVKFTLTAGRDLEWKRWHDIALTAEEKVGKHLSLRQNVAYDPNSGNWRDFTNQVNWQQDPRLGLSLITRYNLELRKLRSATAQLQWEVNPRWKLQWRSNYDGKNFLWNEWLLVRDLHCWEAALRYDSVQDTFGLTFRPKALDSKLVPEIGIGYNNRWTLGTGLAF